MSDDAKTYEEVRQERVENLALQLQSQGLDEFPFGYYKYLAERLLDEEESP
jgi:hypothetical protein